jgi:hypothetical protein
MLVWIINILSIPIYAFVLKYTELSKKQQNSVLVFIMFCQLLFLTVFKDNRIFDDIWAYLIGFNYSKLIDWSRIKDVNYTEGYLYYELGWRYYVKTLSSLSDNEGILIFTTGAIILYSYLALIKKHSTKPWISIFLFITIVFYNSLFVLRQNLAIAICLFSFPFIIERKFWKFILVVGTASLFHKTSIIFIAFYFLYLLKLKIKMILTLLVAGFSFNYLYHFMLETTISYFPVYEVYLNSGEKANVTTFLISLSVLLFIGIQYYPFKKIDKYEKLFFITIIFLTLFDFVRIGSSASTTARLSAYFYPAIIILLPNAIENIKTPSLKYLSTVGVVTLYFLMMINQMAYGFNLNL